MKKRTHGLLFRLFLMFVLIPVLSAGEKENLNRVMETLNGSGAGNFLLEERSLLADYGGFESSLLVASQNDGGERPRGTFVLAVPLYSDFAVDTALAVTEKFRNAGINMLVAFLGGEKNELPEDMGGVSHKGLRDLLSLTDLPENRVLCYFDSEINPDELVLYHGSSGYVAPLEIIKSLPSLFSSFNFPWSFRIRHNSLYKLGMAEGPEALSIIRGEEINGFVLLGEAKNESNGRIAAPRDLAELFLEYADSLNFPIVNPDSNYSVFALPKGKVFFASEWFTIMMLLAAVGISLLLYLLYSVRYNAVIIFHFRLFIKSVWVFFLLFVILVVSFRISGALYSLFTLIPGGSSPASNYIAFVFTILLSLLLFLLPSHILDTIRFPLRERFYGFAAVIFIVFGMLSAAFIDISYIPVFLWAFLFVVLGASVSNGVAVFFSAFLIPVFAGAALLNIFQTDNGKLADLFIFSGWNQADAWMAAFQVAALSLPFFLLVKRGIILCRVQLRPKAKTNTGRKYKFIVIPVLITALIIFMIVQILTPARQIPFERRNISEAAEPGNEETLSVSLEDTVFQDSRIITVNLAAGGNPVRFDVSIAGVNGKGLLPVYAAPVPFEREDEGRRIRFSLGEYPPNPLTVEIVVPLEFEGVLETTAVYNAWDPAVDPEEKPASDNYILRVSRTLDLNLRRNYQRNSALIPSLEESTS